MDLTRPRVDVKVGAWRHSPLRETCDWIAMSMFVAASVAYTIEYWWASKWFAFG